MTPKSEPSRGHTWPLSGSCHRLIVKLLSPPEGRSKTGPATATATAFVRRPYKPGHLDPAVVLPSAARCRFRPRLHRLGNVTLRLHVGCVKDLVPHLVYQTISGTCWLYGDGFPQAGLRGSSRCP